MNIKISAGMSSLDRVERVKLSDALQVEPWFTTELQLRALLGGHLIVQTECSCVVLAMPTPTLILS